MTKDKRNQIFALVFCIEIAALLIWSTFAFADFYHKYGNELSMVLYSIAGVFCLIAPLVADHQITIDDYLYRTNLDKIQKEIIADSQLEVIRKLKSTRSEIDKEIEWRTKEYMSGKKAA